MQLVILQHHSLNQWFTKWYNREIQDKSYTRVLNLDWNIQIKEQKIYEIGIKKITINNAL